MDTLIGDQWRKSSYSGGSGTNCVEVAMWRKASYSGSSGSNCVEVATWRKASYSSSSGSDCVEAGVAEAGLVFVRDTTDRDGALLSISANAWARFTDSLR
jgi:hypothetical protein